MRIMHKLHRTFKTLATTSSQIPANISYYLSLLSSCKDLRSLSCIHSRLLVLGFTNFNSTLSHLINTYSFFQRFDLSRIIFNSATNPDVILYNSMIRAYTTSNKHDDALKLYHCLLDNEILPDNYTYTFVIKACAGNLDINEGFRVHYDVIRNGFELDVYIATGLVHMYCKMGLLDHALQVFGKMPQRDIVPWNAVIGGLSEDDYPNEALDFFRRMQLDEFAPNSVSLLNLFPALCKLENLRLCKSVHGFVLRRNFRSEVFNGLIDVYCKCGFVRVARTVFDWMCGKDHVSWGTMMAGYAHNGYFCEVLELFDVMKSKSRLINMVSVVSSSVAASELRDIEKAKEIHDCAIHQRIDSDTIVATSLVSMYLKCGELEKADELFRKLKEKDVVAWSSVIAAFAQSGFPEEAMSLFREMVHKNFKPSGVTLLSAFPICAELSFRKPGKSIHCYSLKAGIDLDVAIGNALVSMYAKWSSFAEALTVFSRIPYKNVVSWNSLITGYAQRGKSFEVMELFHELLLSGAKPDSETMVGVLPTCALSRDLDQGMCVHGLIIKSGLASACHVKNALIDMYAKCGRLLLAETLFSESDFTKNEVSWNAIIAGYVHNNHSKEALTAFCQMKSEGFQPSAISIVSVFPAVANLTALPEGMAIHAYTVRTGFKANTLIGNSLIDMYAKCGCFDCSEKYFDEMENKDTITWNTMLAAHALHGQAANAVALFSRMQYENVIPDSVSFLSVLSACRHGGLVQDGRKIFHSMHENLHLEPKLEHYACMFDLLGRSGLFSEIMDLIDKMPMEPDAAVWGALLGACRMHSNTDLAEMALNNLVKLEPSNPAHYIGLSSIYAQSGKWVEAKKTRLKMNEVGLKKISGQSWI